MILTPPHPAASTREGGDVERFASASDRPQTPVLHRPLSLPASNSDRIRPGAGLDPCPGNLASCSWLGRR
jgi:hypothetical protein